MRLEAKGVSFRYRANLPAILREASLSIESGERVGLTGPSGCGKSTFSKIIAGYIKANAGDILIDGREIPSVGYSPVQMVYQHPELAMNPRLKLKKSLNEAWTVDDALLERMGIEQAWLDRFPAELSGGELQRFCIARVLGPDTKFLICDEITTMLDVITQAQIWELILDEAKHRDLGLLIITHNEALAKQVCTRVVPFDSL